MIWCRYFFVGVAVALILCFTSTMLFETFFPIAYNSFALSLFLLLVFAFLWIMMAISFVASVLKDAGPVPFWMQLETIEAFVEQEVQAILDQSVKDEHTQDGSRRLESFAIRVTGENTLSQEKKLPIANSLIPDTMKAKENDDREASDHTVRANLMMSVAQTQRLQQNGHHGSNFTHAEGLNRNESDSSDGSDGGFASFDEDNQVLEDQAGVNTVLDHEDLVRRRRRKLQHGLPLLTLLQVARNALDALRGDPETKMREMSFLLNYSFPCKFCSVYKIMGTEHCTICMRCISYRDIHFRWIGQCVGAGNHKYFVLFLFYLGLILAESCAATFYGAKKYYTSFVVGDEVKLPFLFCTFIAAIYSTAIFIFLWKHLHTVGCGDSSLGRIRRANRESVERFARRITPNGYYRPLFSNEPETPSGTFTWDRLRIAVFGVGPWWEWFLPSFPPQQVPEEERESLFWVALGETVERQLRSVVDTAREQNSGNGEEGISVVIRPPSPRLRAQKVVSAEAGSADGAAAKNVEVAKTNVPFVDVNNVTISEGINGDGGRRVPFFLKTFPNLTPFRGGDTQSAAVETVPPFDLAESPFSPVGASCANQTLPKVEISPFPSSTPNSV